VDDVEAMRAHDVDRQLEALDAAEAAAEAHHVVGEFFGGHDQSSSLTVMRMK